MSAPPKFATLPDAIAAYLAGRSRRWAEVDGWQIDLAQAAAEASRVRDEPAVIAPPEPICRAAVHMYNLEVHDNIAAELAAAAAPPPPAAPEPPAWLFGPRHRELDAQRQAAAEAARHAPDAPPATSLPKLCPCCLQPLPGGVL